MCKLQIIGFLLVTIWAFITKPGFFRVLKHSWCSLNGGSWCFKFLEPSERFEIDHVFFMVNWIIQRNATNEKTSLSSLQAWCNLHSNDQIQPDYNLLVFMCTHTHKHHIIYVFPSISNETCTFFAEKRHKKSISPHFLRDRPVQKNSQMLFSYQQGNSKAALCAWIINCPTASFKTGSSTSLSFNTS